MIRKGQVRWLAKGDVIGQVRFMTRPSPPRRVARGEINTRIRRFTFATEPYYPQAEAEASCFEKRVRAQLPHECLQGTNRPD
jgi:hypothetical protein